MSPRRPLTLDEKLATGMARAIEVGDCLEWQGEFNCNGITPCVKVKPADKPPSERRTEAFPVCRILWERAHGPIPEGKVVYRRCMNNACVKLQHFKCGTRAEMHRDRKKAGVSKHKPTTLISLTLAARRRSSTTNSMQKAREARLLAGTGATYAEIAQQVDMSHAMVASTVQGRAWKEIGGSPWAGLGGQAA